jgi:Dyp-type peroxidase family
VKEADMGTIEDIAPPLDFGERPGDDATPVLEVQDMQRLIIYGFRKQPRSQYFFLKILDPAACRKWLSAHLPPIGSKAAPSHTRHGVYIAIREPLDEQKGVRVALAFTFQGLQALELDDDTLNTFVPEFREGMTAPHRARILGDRGKNASKEWRWGQWDSKVFKEHPELKDRHVDMLCAAYAETEAELLEWTRATRSSALASAAFHVVDTLRADLKTEEPFGFKDGISQPYIIGSGRATEKVAERDRIEAGEFVLGYRNQFGRYSESPFVHASLDPSNLLKPAVDTRYRDLGRNGTFLVVRELKQDVRAFAQLPERVAIGAVGRWRNGVPLVLEPLPLDADAPVGPPPRDGIADLNDFSYYPKDAAGLRCPLGAHIRRSNPRDALASPATGTPPSDAQELVNNHRILRRSRVYMREGETGILFQCINTNIERQFEFVQQTWINNVKFAPPTDERDALVGSGRDGALTLVSAPQREREDNLHSYVQVRGGAYFFLPSVRALQYLSKPSP